MLLSHLKEGGKALQWPACGWRVSLHAGDRDRDGKGIWRMGRTTLGKYLKCDSLENYGAFMILEPGIKMIPCGRYFFFLSSHFS